MEAVPEAKNEIRQKKIEKLTEHQQTLYDIIAAAEEIEPSALYECYQEQVSEPKSNRTVRNYLQKMERYNLIECAGENRGRIYRLLT